MASTSEVKAGLDGIAQLIAGSNAKEANAINAIIVAFAQLENIPAQFADVIDTINGYTPTGAFETLTKDEKARLQVEFSEDKDRLAIWKRALAADPSALETAMDNAEIP